MERPMGTLMVNICNPFAYTLARRRQRNNCMLLGVIFTLLEDVGEAGSLKTMRNLVIEGANCSLDFAFVPGFAPRTILDDHP